MRSQRELQAVQGQRHLPERHQGLECALAWMKTDGAKYGIDPAASRLWANPPELTSRRWPHDADDPDTRPDCRDRKRRGPLVRAGHSLLPADRFRHVQRRLPESYGVEIRLKEILKLKKQLEEFEKKYSPVTYVDSRAAAVCSLQRSGPHRPGRSRDANWSRC